MRLLAPDSEAVVYAITCELGLTKIGVAAEAQERRRAMQVGSPVALELAGCYRFPTARAAYAVAADVQRQLGDRHERGGWYRVSPEEVRQAIGNRSAREAPRRAAEARRAASAAEAEAARQRSERVGQRRRGRARARTEKLRAVARLLAAGSTRRAAARELGVAERTIRRWTKLPGFAAELARARARQERELQRAQRRIQKRRADSDRRRFARLNPQLYAESRDPDRKPELRREPKAAVQPKPPRLARPGGHADPPRLPANVVTGVGPARGLVRLESGDGRDRRWVERADLERLLAEGWRLSVRGALS